MSGIKPAIADHFKVLFRDMPDQTFDEIHCGNGFLDVFIIFMTVVMKCNGAGILIIDVNSGCGNDWAPKITSDVFCDCFRVAFVWFCINYEFKLLLRCNKDDSSYINWVLGGVVKLIKF